MTPLGWHTQDGAGSSDDPCFTGPCPHASRQGCTHPGHPRHRVAAIAQLGATLVMTAAPAWPGSIPGFFNHAVTEHPARDIGAMLTFDDCACGHPEYEHFPNGGACWLCVCDHFEDALYGTREDLGPIP